ncbi:bifunctional UDP-N-acetylglucosamine diphosphorylase/glucosamine-1-phosphate N-acetyltransferase GlmU [Candidatus Spongiihabitans sp.]|uniref:bifunctional UDP-N-acetylglucosamine diphosphorylase/glucosamine-1-phosphate N-acetyltransferase GlmU n=1 Tax=Candidatus Spongiihabitans sp. TaxID=3101308 RepID=UPI003C7D7DE0
MAVEIVILAAGQGRRMHSELPKALHAIGGKPMLQHVLETARKLKPRRIHIVVGHGKEQVVEAIASRLSNAPPAPKITAINMTKENLNWVEQNEQRGTGHAVMQALPHIDANSTVLILNGDVPLISLQTLKKISRSENKLNLLTSKRLDPNGLGRIIRDDENRIVKIIEEQDANSQQKKITEVNTNCLSANAAQLCRWLPRIGCDNAQNEYYLTDVVACAVADDVDVVGIASDCAAETCGVNDKSELEKLERLYQARTARRIMASGVTLMDSSRFDVRGSCQFGTDCVVDINVILEGNVKIGNRVSIGPNTLIRNTTIGDNCVIESNSVIDNAIIGNNCNIGPFARIRPETVLNDEVRIGNFVEIKKSNIGNKSKVNHLSYLGDSEVGKNVNIGAGVITCSYDGADKHQTIIGNDVFIGSDSQLIAPLEIGDGATVGAGSTITDNVRKNVLALSRARQTSIDNWKRPAKKKQPPRKP